MQQGPSQRAHYLRRHQIGDDSHRCLLSYSSSIRRNSSIPSCDVFRPSSACIISSLADPSNTRCSTSPASRPLVFSAGSQASYTCALSSSFRWTEPFSVMICSIFSTVVYPVRFFSFSESYTSRMVDGPRTQRTRSISSSEEVGFCFASLAMRAPYYEAFRIVNENLRTITNNYPCHATGSRQTRRSHTTARSRIANPIVEKCSVSSEAWWTWGGSNPRPHRCERCALPTELHAHGANNSSKRAESRQTSLPTRLLRREHFLRVCNDVRSFHHIHHAALREILRPAALAAELLQRVAKQSAHVVRQSLRLRKYNVAARAAGEQGDHVRFGNKLRGKQP